MGLREEDFLFPSLGFALGQVRVLEGKPVSYTSALEDLKTLCEGLGLPRLTLHSARIGAATLATDAGVEKDYIRICGGWKSDAINGYIRPEAPGVRFSEAVLDFL